MNSGIIIVIAAFAIMALIAPSYDNVYDAHRRTKNPNWKKPGRPSKKKKGRKDAEEGETE